MRNPRQSRCTAASRTVATGKTPKRLAADRNPDPAISSAPRQIAFVSEGAASGGAGFEQILPEA
jgi:hypothetical protein